MCRYFPRQRNYCYRFRRISFWSHCTFLYFCFFSNLKYWVGSFEDVVPSNTTGFLFQGTSIAVTSILSAAFPFFCNDNVVPTPQPPPVCTSLAKFVIDFSRPERNFHSGKSRRYELLSFDYLCKRCASFSLLFDVSWHFLGRFKRWCCLRRIAWRRYGMSRTLTVY